jgi:hypothetical protein
MRDLRPPFKFDFRELVKAWRRKLNTRIDGVSISIPFLSFKVKANDLEKRVAKEFMIRMANRRVLSAAECCDNCIDQALASLQEIRKLLEEKQIDLAEAMDSPLYLLLEYQLEAIRQFLTFEQHLKEASQRRQIFVSESSDLHRTREDQESYFAALEMLRGHLHRCLIQVGRIGEVSLPKFADSMRYDESWQLEAYEEYPRMEDRA